MDDRKKIAVLSVISFMDLFAVGLTVPLFSNHVRDLGGTHFLAGLLSSIYSGIQLFSSPLVGSWSDFRGRKTILNITLFSSSIFYFIIGFTTSLYVLFITRILLGFMKHTQTLCKAFIADIVTKEQQSTVYGYTTAFSMIGFIVGPIIGGHLSEYKNGYFYVCSITSTLFVINIILTNLLPSIQEIKHGEIKVHEEIFKVVTDLKDVEWSKYWTIFITKFFHGLAITVYFYNYSILLKENYGISQKTIGYTIAFQSCIGTIAGFFTGWINRRFYKDDDTHRSKYLTGFVIMTISFMLLSIAKNWYYFIIGIIPLAISNAFLRIVQIEILLAKSENDKGTLVGTSNSISSLARLAAPLSSGIVSDIWGQEYVMYYATMLSFLGMTIANVINKKEKLS